MPLVLVRVPKLSHVCCVCFCVPVEPMEPDDQAQTDSQTRTAVPHGRQVLLPSLCFSWSETSRLKFDFLSVCRPCTLTGLLVLVCSYTDPQVSMDLLRAVLQPSFNDDIMAVFRKYHQVSGAKG